MTPLRAVCVVASGIAFAAAVLLGEPAVFAPLSLCALVLFVAGAGSIAADAFPLRSRSALTCSILTPPAAILLTLAGFAGVPPVLAALPALGLSLAPIVVPRLPSRSTAA